MTPFRPSTLKTALFGAFAGACWLLVAETPGSSSNPGPSVRLTHPHLHLGNGLSNPMGEPVLALHEGAGSEGERVHIEALLQQRGTTVRAGADIAPGMLAQQVADVEQYITDYPDGEFTPGLRVQMGHFHRARGRYTKALEHWEAAWNTCKQFSGGNGKLIGDQALAHWSRLLCSLGRTEELQVLSEEQASRIFQKPHLAQIWRKSLEAYAHMRRTPSQAFRCGPLALNNVARVQTGHPLGELMFAPSPVTGYSLSELSALADRIPLNLITAFRLPGSQVIVPSVMHLKQNHYAAIVAGEDGRYLVGDPTFLESVWMDLETLNAEASGYFLVPFSALPTGWRRVDVSETARVFGKGYPQSADDDSGPDCASDCCEAPAGASGTGCGTGECAGMAFWILDVSRPGVHV